MLIKIYLTKNDEIVISIPTILKKTQHLGVSYAPSLSRKFGGTSVANHDAMTACAKIVIADPNTRVVVLSASAGVTNLLVALANGVKATEREKLIGNDLHITSGVAKRIFDTVQSYNVRMISYGASTNNVCMLVQSEHSDEIVRSLHKSLFE